jgi:cytochrome P450
MTTSPPLAPDQLATPEIIADPYPAYRHFRDTSPVRYLRLPAGVVPGIEHPVYSWALLRFADVSAALRDHDKFSSQTSASAFKVMPKVTLLHDDPPRHTHLRRLVNKAFSPKRVDALEPWIAGIARSLLDKLGQGPAEIMSGYAIPLPIKVIATLLGIPPDDYARFRAWSTAVLSYSAMAREERAQSMREMAAFFGEAIAARRGRGNDDLIAALADASVDGQALNDSEVVGFCTLVLLAGNETTTNLIGNMLHILASRPELWKRAREDRSLVDRIIDETLRYESPVQRLPRVATQTVDVRGVTIPAGELVDIFYGAANRDPSAFTDPDTFRLDRSIGEHTAFGAGIHYCLGAPLARVEARITLNEFLDRFATISLASEPAVRQRAVILALGFQTLPLVLGAAGA